jgi:hypothetical protein
MVKLFDFISAASGLDILIILGERNHELIAALVEANRNSETADISITADKSIEWGFDRYIRTCTKSAIIRELTSYVDAHPEKYIKLLIENQDTNTGLVIHTPYHNLDWL